MSQLKVNSIIPVGGVPTGGGGGIIQVVQSQTTTEASNTTTTFADTNLSGTITPTTTNSKILVYISQSFQILMTTAIGGGFQLLRDSTVIYPEAKLYFGNFVSNANFFLFHNMHKLDSPSTTSEVTYKTQMRVTISGSSRTIRSQPSGGTSTITLMEVSG